MRNVLRVLAICALIILQACTAAGIQEGEPAWKAHVAYDGMWLDINDVRVWEDSINGMQLMTRITSKAPMRRTVRYRVLWYTSSGQPIKTLLGKWNEKTILAGQTIDITESAPGPRAKDYKLEILYN